MFEQRYHVDRHNQLTLKQLRLSLLNEMHTNSYTGPRLIGYDVVYIKDYYCQGLKQYHTILYCSFR